MKRLFIIVVFFVITAVSFCQEETVYYANRDDILYEDYNWTNKKTGEIHSGEQILNITGMIATVSSPTMDTKKVKVQTARNEIGWIYTSSISIANSEFLPDEITNNEWTNSYYLDVLRSRNRETLFIYEPFWRDQFHKYNKMFGIQTITDEWYEIANISPFEFANIYAELCFFTRNYYHFIFGKITKNNGKLSFPAVCSYKSIIFEEIDTGRSFPLNERCTITLSLDGDYLDVFIDDKKTFTLVKLNEETRNQFKNLMKNNICDLSHIVWPRRSDGSTDYPLPDNPEEEKQPEPIELSIESVDTETTRNIQNSAKTSAMPLWAWLAIIGGAVLIAGGVVFAVMRSRK